MRIPAASGRPAATHLKRAGFLPAAGAGITCVVMILADRPATRFGNPGPCDPYWDRRPAFRGLHAETLRAPGLRVLDLVGPGRRRPAVNPIPSDLHPADRFDLAGISADHRRMPVTRPVPAIFVSPHDAPLQLSLIVPHPPYDLHYDADNERDRGGFHDLRSLPGSISRPDESNRRLKLYRRSPMDRAAALINS